MSAIGFILMFISFPAFYVAKSGGWGGLAEACIIGFVIGAIFAAIGLARFFWKKMP